MRRLLNPSCTHNPANHTHAIGHASSLLKLSFHSLHVPCSKFVQRSLASSLLLAPRLVAKTLEQHPRTRLQRLLLRLFRKRTASPPDSTLFIDQVRITHVLVVVAQRVLCQLDVLATQEVGGVEPLVHLSPEAGHEQAHQVALEGILLKVDLDQLEFGMCAPRVDGILVETLGMFFRDLAA